MNDRVGTSFRAFDTRRKTARVQDHRLRYANGLHTGTSCGWHGPLRCEPRSAKPSLRHRRTRLGITRARDELYAALGQRVPSDSPVLVDATHYRQLSSFGASASSTASLPCTWRSRPTIDLRRLLPHATPLCRPSSIRASRVRRRLLSVGLLREPRSHCARHARVGPTCTVAPPRPPRRCPFHGADTPLVHPAPSPRRTKQLGSPWLARSPHPSGDARCRLSLPRREGIRTLAWMRRVSTRLPGVDPGVSPASTPAVSTVRTSSRRAAWPGTRVGRKRWE